jgi:hypothetical protein
VRRIAACILLLSFLALGSGALEYLHNRSHAMEDAHAAKLAEDAGEPIPVAPVHNDSNCFIHAQLHLPTISEGCVPLLVAAGLVIAFLTEIARPRVSQQPFFSIDCRGPPAC